MNAQRLLEWDAARWEALPALQRFAGQRRMLLGTAGLEGRDPHDGVTEARVRELAERQDAAAKAVGERFDDTTPPMFPLAKAVSWAEYLEMQDAVNNAPRGAQ